MDCAEFRRALLSAHDASELAHHAASCPTCAQRLRELSAELSCADESQPYEHGGEQAALLRAVEAAVAVERGPHAWLSSRSTALRTGLALSASAAITIAIALFSARADLRAFPVQRLALCAGLYGVLMIALVRQTLRPMHVLQRARNDRLLALLAIGFPFLIGALPPAQLSHPVSLEGQGRDCVALGVLVGLSFVALLRALDRNPAGRSRWLTVAAGTLCANLALLFHCPIGRPAHLLAVHATLVLPLALLLALGAWAARRLARPTGAA